MKKILLISALITVATTSLMAQNDFRKSGWGDSQAEIAKREGLKDIFPESETYGFEGNIGGKECIVGYIFTGDKLFRGVYVFTSTYHDGKEYIRDYDYLKGLLEMKYSEPLSDELTWASKTWKDNPNYYGHALTMGDVSYSTLWITDTTGINLTMETMHGEVVIKIFYESLELTENHQAKILEDL